MKATRSIKLKMTNRSFLTAYPAKMVLSRHKMTVRSFYIDFFSNAQTHEPGVRGFLEEEEAAQHFYV
jgi:hypothetical protein